MITHVGYCEPKLLERTFNDTVTALALRRLEPIKNKLGRFNFEDIFIQLSEIIFLAPAVKFFLRNDLAYFCRQIAKSLNQQPPN